MLQSLRKRFVYKQNWLLQDSALHIRSMGATHKAKMHPFKVRHDLKPRKFWSHKYLRSSRFYTNRQRWRKQKSMKDYGF